MVDKLMNSTDLTCNSKEYHYMCSTAVVCMSLPEHLFGFGMHQKSFLQPQLHQFFYQWLSIQYHKPETTKNSMLKKILGSIINC